MLPNTGTASSPALRDLPDRNCFILRHIGPDEDQGSRMLQAIGVESVDALVADGHWPVDDNPLVNAPHTARALADEQTHPYARITAAFPMDATADKYWPPVSRIDGAHGDKNLVCSCPDIDNCR